MAQPTAIPAPLRDLLPRQPSPARPGEGNPTPVIDPERPNIRRCPGTGRPRQDQPVAPRPAAEGKSRLSRVPGKPGYA